MDKLQNVCNDLPNGFKVIYYLDSRNIGRKEV